MEDNRLWQDKNYCRILGALAKCAAGSHVASKTGQPSHLTRYLVPQQPRQQSKISSTSNSPAALSLSRRGDGGQGRTVPT